jgi:hypothetical protein
MLGKQMTRMPFRASLEMAITKMNSLVMIKTLDMLKITVFGLSLVSYFSRKTSSFLIITVKRPHAGIIVTAPLVL